MIYILYGPDTYRSRQKLKSIIEEFRKKAGGSTGLTINGNLGLERFDAEEDSAETIMAASSTASLFQEKKLIVIERLFSSKKGVMNKIQPKIRDWSKNPANIFIIWDEDVSVKKELAEFLKYAEKSQEFKEPTGQQTKIFMEKEAAQKNVRLSPKEKDQILARHKTNLWAIAGELEKISLGAAVSSGPLLNEEEKIYNFTDALIEKKKTAPKLLLSLLESGFDEIYIFAALVNSFRQLLLIKKIGDNQKTRAKAAKELNIHPYVLEKLTRQAKNYTLPELTALYRKLLQHDINLKLGKTQLEYIVFDFLHNKT